MLRRAAAALQAASRAGAPEALARAGGLRCAPLPGDGAWALRQGSLMPVSPGGAWPASGRLWLRSEAGSSSSAARDGLAPLRQAFATESSASTSAGAAGAQWSAAQAQQAAAASSAAQPGPQSAVSRALVILGNTLLAGVLGGGAFFGYYQLRYDVHELAQLVDASKTDDMNPLQQVRLSPAGRC